MWYSLDLLCAAPIFFKGDNMFSSISAWILSIAGVISLSVVVELLLPEGSLNRYIRAIFSFIVVLVIIAPLPSMVGKQFSYSDIEIEENFSLQEDYIYQLNVYKTEALQESISREIKNRGYDGVVVSVSSEKNHAEYKIKDIFVELDNLVILDKAQHKDILDIEEEIFEIILSYAKVDRAEVHFER